MTLRIGVDLGGTKIEAVAFDHADAELARSRAPTPHSNYDATLDAIVDLIHQVETAAGGTGTIGVGTPGSLSRASGLLRNANSTCLNGQALQPDLEARLGRPVRIANDANCFALSEATDGAGQHARVVFGVILGTGVGGGIVVDGRVLDGPNGIAGEWGHTPFPFESNMPRESCYCGHSGCVETVLCGPALARDHLRASGQALSGQDVGRNCADGDPQAMASVARYAARLVRALATVINILDPDVIVLGGGVSNIEALYEAVPRLWTEQVFSDRIDTRLARAAWGDAGGVRGAAWLWPSPGSDRT